MQVFLGVGMIGFRECGRLGINNNASPLALFQYQPICPTYSIALQTFDYLFYMNQIHWSKRKLVGIIPKHDQKLFPDKVDDHYLDCDNQSHATQIYLTLFLDADPSFFRSLSDFERECNGIRL